MRLYKYNNQLFEKLSDLIIKFFNNVSFPTSPSDTLLNKLGIEIVNSSVENYLTDEQLLKEKKNKRNRDISNLTVTVNDIKFDADLESQNKIINAIQYMQLTKTKKIDWVSADNTVVTVTLSQLKEVFNKSIESLNELWIKPYLDTEE